MNRLSCVGLAAVLAVGLFPGPAPAQQRLTILGMVQWTSTNRIQVMTDSGVSVSIDVSRVDQGSYSGLRGGERVRVVGYVAPERNRVIAESLEVGDASPGYWTFPQTG
jgi:hypothetical protein